METIAQTIPLSAGDVTALEVYRQDGHLVLAVLDRNDPGFPLIQAQLTEEESYALLKALFTEIVSKPLPKAKGEPHEERKRLHDRAAHQERTR